MTKDAEPLLLTFTDAAALLGVTRATVSIAVHEGQLRTVHFGRRTMIPRAAVLELTSGNEKGGK